MFFLYQLLGYLAALGLVALGVRRSARNGGSLRAGLPAYVAGAVLAVAVWFSLWALGLYGEVLWFAEQGFADRFWDVFWAEQTLYLLGAALGASVVLLLSTIAGTPLLPRTIGIIVGLYAGAGYAESRWDEWMLFQNRQSFGVADPAFGMDAGFYVFIMPILDGVYWLLFYSVTIALLTVIAGRIYRAHVPEGLGARAAQEIRAHSHSSGISFGAPPQRRAQTAAGLSPRWLLALTLGTAILLLNFAFGLYLDRYDLIVSGNSVAGAAGWTDLNVRVPMQTAMAILIAGVAVWVLLLGLRVRSGRIDPVTAFGRFVQRGLGGLAVAYVLLLIAAPVLMQRIKVTPSEIRVEAPYIERVMDATRYGFGLDSVERRSLAMNAPLTPEDAEAHAEMLREVRLWDWTALDKVYGQFHEQRLYYDFADVDIDRYRLGDDYRQLMLSVREIQHEDLPQQSQTFVNTRFKYTHGVGLVASPVSEFTREGRERPVAAGIPTQSRYSELQLTQPSIYYGELTNNHVYVKAAEPEFHYPAEGENVEVFYEGTGGVPLSSFVRKLAYAYRFDGMRTLTSSYITDSTRVMFRRNIYERVRALAPFLVYDADAYPVVYNGGITWLMDAYTHTDRYPYSQHTGFGNSSVNYVRNSVKVAVDAYNGRVTYYVFDPRDPLVRAWRQAFPALFKDASEMPEGLREHVRYPEMLMHTQGRVYTRYHMQDITAFYNQEDLWERATETYYGEARPVQPYYILWQEGPEAPLEFILMSPFTPRNRQTMVGWLAGRSDGENYGQLLAYHLPKDRPVPGPQQFESAIDQDSELKRLMGLWGTGGSKVLRGNVLSIPIAGTILHAEPIYIEAASAAYPQLQLVAVQNEGYLGYGRTLEEAMQRMFAQMRAGVPLSEGSLSTEGAAEGTPVVGPTGNLARAAHESFERYAELQARGDFEGAGRELARLREILRTLAGQDGQ